jgi:predicted FMN-binding regulatory protein PaiB
MSTWNYRVVHTRGSDEHGEWEAFAIHEAHYDTPQEAPHSITKNAMTTSFDSTSDLRDALTRMLASLDKPTLDYEDF